ncbi:MAG: right-handed parallel beta-helix repeat-containing protein, partial [Acidimicrobiales bacterium]
MASLVAAFVATATVAVVVPAGPAAAAPGDISTVAFPMPGVWGVDEVDGELVVSQAGPFQVGPAELVRVDAEGNMTPFAGGGTIALGDGGAATDAALDVPEAVAVDSAGNLFVSDRAGHRVRRVATGGDGVVDGGPDEAITTVVGTGTAGFSGDGGPATGAEINLPDRLAFDAAGNLLLSDEGNARVRRVAAGTDGLVDGDADEIITTVAGNGTPGPDGDGGPATEAGLTARALALDADGVLYIGGGNLVRAVSPGADGIVDGDADEVISTFAGGGDLPPGGGAAATDVALDNVYSLAFDAGGNLFVVSTDIDVRNYVLRIAPDSTLTAVVGAGPLGGAGDGGPAVDAELSWPYGLTFDGDGNLYVGELTGHRVRRVAPGGDGLVTGEPDEVITRLAGTGTPGGAVDGGAAALSPLNSPAGLGAAGADLYIADRGNNRVRRVDAGGTITTVAGGGAGDGLPATEAVLSEPRGVVVAGDGTVIVADCGNSRVRAVDTEGVIDTLLGPVPCPSGLHLVDDGPEAGTLYVSLAGGHEVIKRTPAGVVTTVAGTGSPGFAGDGGPAAAAKLNAPAGVTVDGDGTVYVADTANHRVRRVDAGSGAITTVAGNGSNLFGTLGGVPATATSVAGPEDVVVDGDGNLIIAETLFSRIRKVGTDGIVSTIAGNGIPAFGGDGGPAADAVVSSPTQLDLDGAGDLFFTDRGNASVRRIEAGTPPPPPVVKKPECGSVITKNTILTADIGPCDTDGIVIGRDNIRLNLNGYRIFGTEGQNSTVGIRLFGRSGVTITGGGRAGSVSGFDAGVAIIGGGHNVVEKLSVHDNDGFDIYGDGIASFFSSFNQIRDNEVARNGLYDGIGILGIGSQGNVVQRNTVSATNAQGEIFDAGIGIVLTPFLSEGLPRELSIFENKILDNTVRDNDNSGISNISNVNGVISGNRVVGNGRLTDAIPANGIGIQNLLNAPRDTNVVVQGNVVLDNGSLDVDGFAFSGNGIDVLSRNNRVVGNRVEGSILDGINVAGDTNQIEGNRVSGNGRDGIIVTAHDGLVRGNRVRGNTASGIKAEFGSSGNQFLDNDAIDNGEPIADFDSFVFQGDLVDVNADFQEDPFLIIFNCGTNTWSGNSWGSGGFFPDPALSDPEGLFVLIEEACTTTGGDGPAAA